LFYKTFYPAYPDQLVDAIVLRMKDKLQRALLGQCASEDLFNGSVLPQSKLDKINQWDYTQEVTRLKEEGQMAIANKKMEELLVGE